MRDRVRFRLICVERPRRVARDMHATVDPCGRQYSITKRKGHALVHLGDDHRAFAQRPERESLIRRAVIAVGSGRLTCTKRALQTNQPLLDHRSDWLT